MSAAELARSRDANALPLYLSQPHANPAVCDASAPGPHIAIDDEGERALVGALVEGRLAPAVWRSCADRIFATSGRAGQTMLLDEIAGGYGRVIAARRRWPASGGQLAALEGAYRERPPELAAHAEVMDKLTRQLRTELTPPSTLNAVEQRSVSAMLATIELERGLWQDKPIDPAMIDRLVGQRSEPLLTWFAARLPDLALRDQAERGLIRLRIQRSLFPEIRDDAQHVQEVVATLGANPITPRLQPATDATLDASKLSLHQLEIRQDVLRQTAKLADAELGTGTGHTMIGALSLRGALQVKVTGLSQPITLCGALHQADPTPCLLPGDAVIASPLVWRDRVGEVHFVEEVAADQVVALARSGPALRLPVTIGGRELAALEAPVAFVRPPDTILAARSAGGDGPPLAIEVEAVGDRLIYAIQADQLYRMVGSASDLPRIVSRGADGAAGSDGSPGSDGSDGSAGSSGSCPGSGGGNGGNGSDGGRGGDGSNGDDGGKGGAIQVAVRCDDGVCAELIAALRGSIHSVGGDGGPGGSGGRGGRGGSGGSGGSGASCTDADGNTSSVSGGSSGSSGSDGASGSDGRGGAAGAAGEVRFSVKRADN